METSLECLPKQQVELGFFGPAGTKVTLAFTRSSDGYGHDHATSSDGPPESIGTLEPSAFTIPEGAQTAENAVKVCYTAPEVCVRLSVCANTQPDGMDVGSYIITVMVPGLAAFYDLPAEQQVGVICSNPQPPHLFAHSGTPELLEAITALGAAFHAEFNASFTIGNASLEFGGLLDINNDWKIPCDDHALGQSVDILMKNMPEDQRAWLQEKAGDFGFRHNIDCGATDGEPWHLTVAYDPDPIETVENGKTVFILPHRDGDNPGMPKLIARLPGGTSAKKVQWRLRVEYARGNGAHSALPQDIVDIPGRPKPDEKPNDGDNSPYYTDPMPGDQDWLIYESDEWVKEVGKGFFGGDALLCYSMEGEDGETELAHFKILGKNPKNRICRTFIDTNRITQDNGLWFAYAVAKSETSEFRFKGSLYHEFICNPHNPHVGYPAWSRDNTGPGGYGIMQVTPQDDIPRRLIWNWQQNIEAGLTEIVVDHLKRAKKWMAEQIDADHANGTPIPTLTVGNVTFAEGTERTMLDAVTLKNYNGMSQPPADFKDPDGEAPGFKINVRMEGDKAPFCFWNNSDDENLKGWCLCRYNNNYTDGNSAPFNYVSRVCAEVE
jgi:hypothetical protein